LATVVVQVLRCSEQAFRRIVEMSDADVARLAQEGADYSGNVVVIDVKNLKRLFTDGAETALRYIHLVIFGGGDSVATNV